MTIGEKLKLALQQRRWSASELSRSVGVTPAAISRIVNGGDTSTSLGLSISKALGVAADWLFDDAQDWPPPSAPSNDQRTAIRDLPDAVVIEEALRRRRAVHKALQEIAEQYANLRDAFRRANAGGADRVKNEHIHREMLAFLDSAVVYVPTMMSWARWEGSWDALTLVRPVGMQKSDVDLAEMSKVFDLFGDAGASAGDAERRRIMDQVFALWSAPDFNQKRLELLGVRPSPPAPPARPRKGKPG